jgi:hypothetical protein
MSSREADKMAQHGEVLRWSPTQNYVTTDLPRCLLFLFCSIVLCNFSQTTRRTTRPLLPHSRRPSSQRAPTTRITTHPLLHRSRQSGWEPEDLHVPSDTAPLTQKKTTTSKLSKAARERIEEVIDLTAASTIAGKHLKI